MTTEEKKPSTKNSEQVYKAESRGTLLNFDPDKLTIVDDPKHPLYDERHKRPLNETMIKSIMTYGVLDPIEVRKNPETGDIEVVDGRGRVKNAREANRRLREANQAIKLVPGTVAKAADTMLASHMIVRNEHREADNPMNRARKARMQIERGLTEEQVALEFAVNPATIRNLLALLDACKEVQKAVESGRLNTSIAYKLARMPPDVQRTKLAEVLALDEAADEAEDAVFTYEDAKGDIKPKKTAKKAVKKGVRRKKGQGQRANAIVSGPTMRGKREVNNFLKSVSWKNTKGAEGAKAALLWVMGDEKALDEFTSSAKDL